MEDRLIFTVDTADFRWSDVEFAARCWGTWEQLERRTAAGIAALAEARFEQPSQPVDEEELEAEENEFRYRRDLLTADELSEWLELRNLDLEDWRGFLLRAAVRERFGSHIEDVARRHPVTTEAIDAAIEAEGFCSGLFAEMAESLASMAACWGRSRSENRAHEPEISPPLDSSSLAVLGEAQRRFVDGVATDQALEREVAGRLLDWIRLVGASLRLPDEEAAREAAMCVRQDSQDLATAGRRANVPVRRFDLLVEDTDPEWRPALVPARAGDLVGPLADRDGYVVLQLTAKIPPRPTDRTVRERARGSLVARAVDRAVNDLVVWHAAL